MTTPFQLTVRHMVHSPELAAHIEKRAKRLDDFCRSITSCHVVVAFAGHHHRDGDKFLCSITLAVPGHDIVVGHNPPEDRIFASAYESADVAFDEAERQLTDWERRRRDGRHTTLAPTRNP